MRSSIAKGTRPARSGLLVSLLVLLCSSVVYSYQGVASPGPLARPAAPIQSNLPSIVVNFKDIAEQAGLTAVNVSGGVDKKDYILETTGDGVGIFDYDNDGLMDILLVKQRRWTAKDVGPPQPAIFTAIWATCTLKMSR